MNNYYNRTIEQADREIRFRSEYEGTTALRLDKNFYKLVGGIYLSDSDEDSFIPTHKIIATDFVDKWVLIDSEYFKECQHRLEKYYIL
jgi:hypothetical protein